MSTVIHRTTLEVDTSANTAKVDFAVWLLINADNPLPSGQSKYWKIVGDTVQRMNATERAAVDVNDLRKAKSRKVRSLYDDAETYMGDNDATVADRLLADQLTIEAIDEGYTTRQENLKPLRQFVNAVTRRTDTAILSVKAATNVSQVRSVSLDTSGIVVPTLDISGQAGVNE